MSLKPRTKIPALDLPTLGGGRSDLSPRASQSFSMLVFYRGLQCPISKNYLRDLDGKLDDFAKRGVEAVAISTDTQERVERSRNEWASSILTIA